MSDSSAQTDSLKCVALASKNRSLADFEKVRAWNVHLLFLPPVLFVVGFFFVLFFFCALIDKRLSWSPNLQALTDYKSELRDDPIISTHLTKLYDNLLEQNLIRVIEPFSRVQVTPPTQWPLSQEWGGGG